MLPSRAFNRMDREKNSKNPDIPEAISLKYPHITPIFVEKQDVT